MIKYAAVIPLYNKEAYVLRALTSALNQLYPPTLIVVVDDCSTDNSLKLVEEFKIHHDNIEILKLKNNSGVSFSRNYGVKYLDQSIEYVSFLDADDYWAPSYMLEVANAVEACGKYDLLFTGYHFVSDRATKPATIKVTDQKKKYHQVGNLFDLSNTKDLPISSTSSVCIRVDTFKKSGGFIEGINIGEDQLLWLRLSYQSDFIYISKPLVFYDISVANSLCKVHLRDHVHDYIIEIENDYWSGQVPADLQDSCRKYLYRYYLKTLIFKFRTESSQSLKDFILKHEYYFNLNRVTHHLLLLFCSLPALIRRSTAAFIIRLSTR